MSHPKFLWLEAEGQVICEHDDTGGCRTVSVPKEDMPIPAWKVAHLMNTAYEYGMRHKAAEFRRLLEIRE
jgi:urease accessory protein UreE